MFFTNKPTIIITPKAPDIGYIKLTKAENGTLPPIIAKIEHISAIKLNFNVPSFAKLLHTLLNRGTAVVYIPAFNIKENIIPIIGPILSSI